VYLCMDCQQKQSLINLLVGLRGSSSQRQFAKNFGVSYAALRSWESGESLPTLDNLESIAKLKGWSLIELFNFLGHEISNEQLLGFAMNKTKEERLEIAKRLLNSV
jgi:transcriptional regulator with XRE-family HTH domain